VVAPVGVDVVVVVPVARVVLVGPVARVVVVVLVATRVVEVVVGTGWVVVEVVVVVDDGTNTPGMPPEEVLVESDPAGLLGG
jgi:hypothetical protein